MAQDTRSLRKLGDYERYSVARALIGVHPIVVGGVALPNKVSTSTLSHQEILHEVVKSLASQELALSVVLENETDLRPNFARLEIFDPSKVVHIDEQNQDDTKCSIEERINNLIKRHINNQFDLSDKKTPLWRLVLERGKEQEEEDILAIVTSHTIADGSSNRRLLAHAIKILDQVISSNQSHQSHEPHTLDDVKSKPMAGAIEDLYPVRPGFGLLARTIYKEIIRPKLPQRTPEWLFGPLMPEFWNGSKNVESSSVLKSSFASRFIFLPCLHSVAHSNPFNDGRNVTVQAILQVLFQAAILKTHARFSNDQSDGLNLLTSTPIGLDPPDGYMLGNYVAGIDRLTRCTSSTKFWDEVFAYYNFVHNNPHQRAIAIQRMGLLAYAPNGDLKEFLLSKFAENTTDQNTENVVMDERTASFMRFSASIELSNVGILDRERDEKTLLSKCTKSFVAQTATAHACPIAATIISVNKSTEIAIHIGWRECVFDDEWVQFFTQILVTGAHNLLKLIETPNVDLNLDELFV